MSNRKKSRREFLGASAGVTAALASVLADPPHAAAQAAGPYHKDKFRVDEDGYILAPTEPGLGCPIDRDALDKIMKRVDR
jgi:L-alanine-DL-glutamate epimerase-like enolase superfamily enzyme